MTEQHPITPPPELVEQWASDMRNAQHFATQAARWGADQELEACCSLLNGAGIVPPDGAKTYPENQLAARERAAKLRADRRPKPPSLAEKALEELDLVPTHDQDGLSIDADTSVIRRALERLQELESQ